MATSLVAPACAEKCVSLAMLKGNDAENLHLRPSPRFPPRDSE